MNKYLSALWLLACSGAVLADGGNIAISGMIVNPSCSVSVVAPAASAPEALFAHACAADVKAHVHLSMLNLAPLEKNERAHLDGDRIEPANAKVVFAAYL
ncbi:MAG: hypothetical protein KA214_02785 [Neisseriaceae bacterium]|nr:hypothetical protein [Neisseriaceae bacterium]